MAVMAVCTMEFTAESTTESVPESATRLSASHKIGRNCARLLVLSGLALSGWLLTALLSPTAWSQETVAPQKEATDSLVSASPVSTSLISTLSSALSSSALSSPLLSSTASLSTVDSGASTDAGVSAPLTTSPVSRHISVTKGKNTANKELSSSLPPASADNTTRSAQTEKAAQTENAVFSTQGTATASPVTSLLSLVDSGRAIHTVDAVGNAALAPITGAATESIKDSEFAVLSSGGGVVSTLGRGVDLFTTALSLTTAESGGQSAKSTVTTVQPRPLISDSSSRHKLDNAKFGRIRFDSVKFGSVKFRNFLPGYQETEHGWKDTKDLPTDLGGFWPAPPASSGNGCSAALGHDHGGANRQITSFTAFGGTTRTQLQLIGTHREHVRDDGSREAPLPPISPD
jgi:hypothetical protein